MDISPQSRETETKVNKWNYIKLRSFCRAKQAIDRKERSPTEFEKIFTNNISHKALIFKVYKELTSVNTEKKTY